MKKEEFELLCKSYSPHIKRIIETNAKFYRYSETIKWGFGYDEDESIMAVCNRETNIITVNLKSVMISYNRDELRTVEYYLLHEIRHAFQHLIIKDYQAGIEIPIDEDIVEKWIFEGEHYIKSLDENGKENVNYFLQDSELDAYAFSLAVMKYKYKDVSNLYIPDIYGTDFYSIVDSWIETFKEESL